jgi:hypothetical protein
MNSSCRKDELLFLYLVYQKSLGAWHDEPNKPTKGKGPFHMCSWSPHFPPFQSWQEPLQFSLFGCIHEQANPDAGNPEARITSQKNNLKPDRNLQMDDWDIHCLAGWWLVAAGVYLDQVQAQLLAADSPFHHTTHNNPIYD